MDNYSEIIDNFHNENTLREEGIEIFEISGYKKINENCLKNLNQFNSIMDGNKTKTPDFYQNHSFRVPWCKDGFVSFAGNKNGFYELDINEIVTHGEIFIKDEMNPKYNYLNYLNNLTNFNKKYKIFFKALFDDYKFHDIDDYKFNWRQKNVFMKRLLKYISKYSNHLHNTKEIKNIKNMFFKEEIMYLSLLDILFGDPPFCIIQLVKSFQKTKVTEERLQSFLKKVEQKSNYSNSEAHRKILLSKWLEIKAEPVLKYYIFIFRF